MKRTHHRHGRKKPYTVIGIRRLPCFRCGKAATQQWQICADGNTYRPICTPCDIDLNRIVLIWAGDPQAAKKLKAYARKVQG